LRGPNYGLREGHAVQLDGLSRHCRGHDHQFNYRQDRHSLYARLYLLRPGFRALGGQYVRHSDGHDDGRQSDGRRLVGLESDSGHAWQSGRWLHLYRPGDLSHAQASCGYTRAVESSDAGAGGMSDARSEEHTSELQSLTNLVCRLLLEKKNTDHNPPPPAINPLSA